ncbi:MAG TPA: amidohydrolase [Bacteroidetes bacterium]|nr:amidohydrolase [Bacteroidota bacterium]
MNLKDKIKQRAAQIHEEIRSIRHHLHQNPELSFQEHETQQFVEEQLKQIGISEVQRIADTGLVAYIRGTDNGKTIALRADMDALPIQEVPGRPYGSKNPGVMHACGHDVHTTSLLGAAKLLNETRGEWSGTIKLLFQPGEEKMPGGATLMIRDGAIKGAHSIIGQHVMPLLPVGTVGFRSGLYMASADEIHMTVKGKGGHGAMPQFNIDPVLITAHILTSLQQIVSRNASPIIPSVLSFGKVIANGATNVIPNEVKLEGTFRTLDEAWRAEALEKIKKMAEGIAESMGGYCEVNIVHGYPFLKNDERLSADAKTWAIDYLGADKVHDLDIWMAAEDFSYYSQEMPACFYRLGVRNEAKGITSSVHTPNFDIDEDALLIGAGLMAWLALKELGN